MMSSAGTNEVRHRAAAESRSQTAGATVDTEASDNAGIQHITLRSSPLKTLYLFALVVVDYVSAALSWVHTHHMKVLALAVVAACITAAMSFPGEFVAERDFVAYESKFIAYWILLGVASSVGLGSGLHTFLLFLGPHIIRVAVHAGTCDSVDFSAELVGYWPYPKYAEDAWDCGSSDQDVTFFQVVGKVLWPAFLWGVGTAIGELPPYFMARAARLSGEKMKELQELEEEEKDLEHQNILERAKAFIHQAVERWGFWAILASASIPNPLFDLAGITCGHLLIPFWTFFGATAIGKGVIKVSLQALFYVVVFSPKTLAALRRLLPFETVHKALDMANKGMGSSMSNSCWQREILQECGTCCTGLFPGMNGKDIRAVCNDGCGGEHKAAGIAGTLWNGFIMLMCLWFLASIINASANSKLIELEEERRAREKDAPTSANAKRFATLITPTDETDDVDIAN